MKLALILSCLISLPLFAANRPHLKIKIQDSFVCKDGKSQGRKIYSRFCKAKSFNSTTLFIHAVPSAEVIFGELMSNDATEMGDLFSWCVNEISDGRIGPSCVLEVTNIENGQKNQLSLNISQKTNMAVVNVSSLPHGVRYNARIVETGSGSNASTETFEVVVR
ncbi:MAG: hypothetical protein ACJAT2_003645 [Bacteriovoracaceae bacterium]|jgi:hypothetical protein